jgi:hypothetical protein
MNTVDPTIQLAIQAIVHPAEYHLLACYHVSHAFSVLARPTKLLVGHPKFRVFFNRKLPTHFKTMNGRWISSSANTPVDFFDEHKMVWKGIQLE